MSIWSTLTKWLLPIFFLIWNQLRYYRPTSDFVAICFLLKKSIKFLHQVFNLLYNTLWEKKWSNFLKTFSQYRWILLGIIFFIFCLYTFYLTMMQSSSSTIISIISWSMHWIRLHLCIDSLFRNYTIFWCVCHISDNY